MKCLTVPLSRTADAMPPYCTLTPRWRRLDTHGELTVGWNQDSDDAMTKHHQLLQYQQQSAQYHLV